MTRAVLSSCREFDALLRCPRRDLHHFLRGRGQVNGHPGALSELALDTDRARVTADDAEHRCQSKATTGKACREEGVEQVLEHRRVHPVTVVLDLEHREDAGLDSVASAQGGQLVRRKLRAAHSDANGLGPGVARVRHKVEKDLLDLRRVSEAPGRSRVEVEFDGRSLTDGGT